MIGCSVTSMQLLGRAPDLDEAAPGQREAVPEQWRTAGCAGSGAGPAAGVWWAWRVPGSWSCRLLLVSSLVVGACAGQGEEHLVQAGQVQGQLGDGDARGGRAAPTAAASAASPRTGTLQRRRGAATPAAVPATSARTAAPRPAAAPGRPAGPAGVWPPTIRLSSSGVPWAMTRPWSMTVISSASASASSRYCVVSRTVDAVGDQAAHDVPHVLALGRVEAGGRLVEEDHRRPADQARGQVEPAAHAAGVGLGRPVGRLGQVEPSSSSRGPAPCASRGAGRAAGRSAPGSRVPVRSSSTEAYWPVSPISRRTRPASRTTS